jgi:predicted MPP superfamily phosphohydrolase
MILFLKILFLIWSINLAPPLLAHFLHDKWNAPLDRGRTFWDGKPILGPHKTIRGVYSATLMGWMVGLIFGFPWYIGFLAGILSMGGDLLSSFIKRRLGMASGSIFAGLDQVFEGVFPFFVITPYFDLSAWETLLLLAFFCVGAYVGSLFFKAVLLDKPFPNYPRPVNSWVRLREFRSCQITSNPLHHFVNFEDSLYYHILMKTAFKALGIYEKGKRNALQIRKHEVTFSFPELPPSFDDYKILFFSDLHLDGLEGLTENLQVVLREVNADLCILGGDFRMETHGPFAEALSHLRRVIPEIRSRDGILGVLGNHDCVEIVGPLQKCGVCFLVNDALPIERNGDRIWIAGVDDPHYYKCHDLAQAFEDVPRGEFCIFVAHSNEVYKEAEAYGPKLYLCGHTHAGQIKLPYVGPVFTHSSAPRRFCEGSWKYGNMAGYTSCGVGVSGVPVRFACSGEVLVIRLKRSAA